MGEVIDLGVKQGLVDKSGAWYAYKGDKIGQGKANSARFLEENPAIAEEIEALIRAQLLTVAKRETKETREADALESEAAKAAKAVDNVEG